MTDDPYEDRKRLTFEQAEGAEELPTQLRTKELSKKLRACLWLVVYESLSQNIRRTQSILRRERRPYIEDPWRAIFYNYHTVHKHLMADEFNDDPDAIKHNTKTILSSVDYVAVFGFLQFVLRDRNCPYQFPDDIDMALKNGHAAYRVLEKTIIPISSEAELETLQRAFADLAASEFLGARSHLHSSASHLTTGDHASSVRESIHAVESVARTLEPSGKLSKALGKLERSSVIHPALKKGFLEIYGYTSDENGIRHALLQDPQADVDEADALFMIGSCAAFVSYMIHKARLAGLLAS